jgi:hypothetical protein
MRFLISMSDVEDEWDGLPDEERERMAGAHAAFQAASANDSSPATGSIQAAQPPRCGWAPTAGSR